MKSQFALKLCLHMCDANKKNVSISKSDKISGGNYAIFYDSINQRRKDVLLCGTPVIIYASCHEQNEGPVGHYTLLNPCNVVRPKMRAEESIFFRPFPRC